MRGISWWIWGLQCAICFGVIASGMEGIVLEDLVDPNTQPNAIHLAFTGDTTQMVVSWFTKAPTNNSIVKWGFSSNSYPFTTSAVQNTFNKETGYTHDAILNNLKPSTKYYYICGDPQGGLSEEYQFTSAPLENAYQSFSIAMYGDMGVTGSENTVYQLTKAVQSGEISWIYHLGDISYADDRFANEYEAIWNQYFDIMQPIMTNVPYMVAVGNNDKECKFCFPWELPYARNFTTFKNRFRMPGKESGTDTNLYFSFNYGPVHFISISTETNYPGSPSGGDDRLQLKWLENDLKIANLPENRAKQPWIIVTGHRPIYTSIILYNFDDEPIGEAKTLQLAFEDLFKKYHVDIFFNGHIHGYERNWPVYRSIVNSTSYIQPKNPIHIMSGAAGDIEGMDPKIAYSVFWPSWTAFRFIDSDIIDWEDYKNAGYGILRVYNATNLRWQFFKSSNNTLVDQIDIVNDHKF